MKYVVLLRGINVGGKNKVSMTELKLVLENAGFVNVSTYINSGNVILESPLDHKVITKKIESLLPEKFTLDSSIIKVLPLSCDEFQAIINRRPKGFGEQPEKYHSDVIFLMGITATETIPIFNPREGIDTVWPGNGVIYSQRLSEQRTKSRLNKIMMSPLYQSMTIRNWNTTTKLLELLKNN